MLFVFSLILSSMASECIMNVSSYRSSHRIIDLISVAVFDFPLLQQSNVSFKRCLFSCIYWMLETSVMNSRVYSVILVSTSFLPFFPLFIFFLNVSKLKNCRKLKIYYFIDHLMREDWYYRESQPFGIKSLRSDKMVTFQILLSVYALIFY